MLVTDTEAEDVERGSRPGGRPLLDRQHPGVYFETMLMGSQPGRDPPSTREIVGDQPSAASVPRTSLSRSILPLVGLVVSAGFTYLAVRRIHFGEVWTGLRTSEYVWLLPGLAVLGFSILLRAIRWQYMFAAGTRPGLAPATSSLLIGYFFNSVLPARAGEAVRIVALHQR